MTIAQMIKLEVNDKLVDFVGNTRVELTVQAIEARTETHKMLVLSSAMGTQRLPLSIETLRKYGVKKHAHK